MAESLEYLSMVPVDTLRYIIHPMDVVSVQKLQEACKDNSRYKLVVSECDRRLSTSVYIDEYFGSGEKFMKAMSKCGASVVGPRATGFFVRNSVSNDSVWDINVNYDDENVFEFISDLTNIGVTWYTVKEEVTNLLESKSGALTLDRFKYASALTHIIKLSKELGYQMCNSTSGNGTRVRLRIETSTPTITLIISDAAFDDDSAVRESVWMCTGYKSTAYGDVKVRLSGERGRLMGYYPKSFINDHSSYRQAIISPYFAWHLYGKLACEMRTHQWERNMTAVTVHSSSGSTPPRPMPGSAAMLSGEFKYEPLPSTPLLGHTRSINDEESIWLGPRGVYYHDQTDTHRYIELLKHLLLLQSPLGLSSSTVNQVSLTAVQPWTPFRDRNRVPTRDAEGVYIPSLWASAFGEMIM